MGSVSNKINRCKRCKMHESLCICSLIPTFDLATRVVLIMHRRETTKVSSTGPLALECLTNKELRVHGNNDSRVDLTDLDHTGRRLLMLFPGMDAVELNKQFVSADKRPVTLVVPDGNWGQAMRMARRLPGTENATRVTLPPGQKTAWGLRKETFEGGLATFEAIARSLGIVEGEAVQHGLEALFNEMVRRTRKLRGARP